MKPPKKHYPNFKQPQTQNKYQQPRSRSASTPNTPPPVTNEGTLPEQVTFTTPGTSGQFIVMDLSGDDLYKKDTYQYDPGDDFDLDSEYDNDQEYEEMSKAQAEEAKKLEEEYSPLPAHMKKNPKKGYGFMPPPSSEQPVMPDEAYKATFANAIYGKAAKSAWSDYMTDEEREAQQKKLDEKIAIHKKVAESLGISPDQLGIQVEASTEVINKFKPAHKPLDKQKFQAYSPFDEPGWAPSRDYSNRYEPVPDISDVEATDEEVLVNAVELADHYAQSELKKKFEDFSIEKYVEEYNEAYDRHLELITSFKRNKNV